MRLSSHNVEMAKLVGPDNYPLDWPTEPFFYGISKNEALKLYVVRLSVSGKQYFLGNAYSQPIGAKLYDYALWKFAGKMSRAVRPNFPDEFAAITQAEIDQACPRLNEIYAKLPFLATVDEAKSEAELRVPKLALNAPPVPGDKDFFQTVLRRLKRLRLQSTENFEHVTEWNSRLALQKVPELYNRFASLEQEYANLSKNLLDLEASMESNHAYYRQLKYDQQHTQI